MKYYHLKDSINKKVVGINDGGSQAEMVDEKWNKEVLDSYKNDYLFGIWDIVAKIKNGEQVPHPKFDYIEMRHKAILTDFLTFSEPYAGGDYLVSSKVESIIKKFNVDCRFYHDVSLWQLGKKIEGYSNLHLIPLYSKEVLNFEKSVFFRGSEILGKTFRYPASYEEFFRMSKEHEYLLFESLDFDEVIVGDLDMFSIDLAASIMFVSERLKLAFENAGVSGVSFVKHLKPTITLSS